VDAVFGHAEGVERLERVVDQPGWAAEEVVELVGLVLAAQDGAEQPDVDLSGVALPTGVGPSQHLGDLQVELLAQPAELVAEQQVLVVAGDDDEPVRSRASS
jgi:hypothetical protein